VLNQDSDSSHTSKETSTCCLPTPATRLAKLYGHMLAHGLVPDLAENLQCLTSLLSAGPLQGNGSSCIAGRYNAAADRSLPGPTNEQHKAQKSSTSQQQQQQSQQSYAGSLASAVPTPQQQGQIAPQTAITCPEDLLRCKTCAARFAAKALECCSKLLCCLPLELLQGLAASPHVQLYAKGLAQALSRVVATTSHIGHGGCPSAMMTPVSSSLVYDKSALHTPSSAVTPSSTATGSSRTTTGRLSGCSTLLPVVGLLAPNSAANSAGKGASAGAAGKLTTAALNNREKCRDLFFSILRKCSTRLDSIRQQQQQSMVVASSVEPQCHQSAAAAAEIDTELQELVAEVGLAAKQLLLQLAPSNQPYLAELFTACVLQAASSGEPILDPQLAMMAVRDPGKFQKLQQRVELTTSRATARQPAGQMMQQQVGSTPSRSSPAAVQLEPKRIDSPAPLSWGGEAVAAAAAAGGGGGGGGGGPPGSSGQRQPQLMRQQQLSAAADTPVNSSLRATASHSGLTGAAASHQKRHRPPQQHQHILAVLDGGHSQQQQQPGAKQGSSSSGLQTKGSYEQQQQQQHTPRNAHSTGNSFRLSATAGMSTPLPFAASPGLAASSPGVASGAWAAGPAPLQEAGSSSSSSRTMSRISTHQQQQPQQRQQTPASAPPTVPVVAAVPSRAGHVHKGTVTPASASQHGKGGSSSSTSHQVVLQLLAELPAGQHVLMLVLHTADSSSFNRSLLNVMLERAHNLLNSCPASFTSAAGLGQHAAALAALASYCSYLAFAAGCSTEHQQTLQQQQQQQQEAAAAAPAVNQQGSQGPEALAVLQQQPAVDVSSLLAQALDPAINSSSDNISSSSLLDRSWYFALAVPYACRYLTFSNFLPSAADSSSVRAVVAQLRQVQRLPCLAPSHGGFGSLAAAVSSMLSSCQQLQRSTTQPGINQPEHAAAAAAAAVGGDGRSITAAMTASAAAAAAAQEVLCSVVGQGNGLVDSAYWAVCCPGLQQVASSLMTDLAALQRQQQQQQQPQRTSATSPARRASPRQVEAGASAAKPLLAGSGGLGAPTAANGGRQQSSCLTAPSPADTGSSSPAGSAGSAAPILRHTTPLLLAPRAPPELSEPPGCIQSALASTTDPLKQQLQQAFISQYSTDDMQVRRRMPAQQVEHPSLDHLQQLRLSIAEQDAGQVPAWRVAFPGCVAPPSAPTTSAAAAGEDARRVDPGERHPVCQQPQPGPGPGGA
jgi:hypothetical protein